MLAIHQKGKEALDRYRADHQARTDALVSTLRDLVVAYGKEGTTDERMAAMDSVIGDKASEVLQSCEEHLAHVGNNYQQFLWPFYKSHRAQLFRLLSVMDLRSSSRDQSLEETVAFLKRNAPSKGEWLIRESRYLATCCARRTQHKKWIVNARRYLSARQVPPRVH